MTDIEVPVLIVGGGGCGLSSSIFLSAAGVDHLLVERHEGTSDLPKAHYLNQRTMEVLRQHGVADAVYAQGATMEKLGRVRWVTTLGGDGPLDGRTFFDMDCFGGGATAEAYARSGATPPTNLPQMRLEPVLRAAAEQRAQPGRIKFNHELVELSQDADGVTSAVLDRATGQRLTVRSRYLIAADAGKTIGPLVGVEMHGPTGLVDLVSMHFEADLSHWWDDNCIITFLNNPSGGDTWGSGAMAQMGPTWGSKSENFNIVFGFKPDDPGRFDEETIIPKARNLLNLPDLEITCHKINHWIVEGLLADRYRVGRVLIGGDAAHRHPPTTGLGLNTAIQDAHNLAWKLAAVINHDAPESLLDSYESERRPIGARNVEWAMLAFGNHAVVNAAMGFMPGAPPEANEAIFTEFFSDTPMGATRRARFAEVAATSRIEFQAIDLDLGFHYEQGALVADGTAPPPADPMGSTYQPSTRPGHRLPHAWLIRDGVRLSTHDLTGASQRFVLITGPGTGWAEQAAAAAKELGVEVAVATVGDGGEYGDLDGSWAQLREVPEQGAVLVRPDNHVAWRANDPGEDLVAALHAVWQGHGS